MESSTNQKVAIVTGSSTGIGYETSLALARNGFLTYAIGAKRNMSDEEFYKMMIQNFNKWNKTPNDDYMFWKSE